MSAILYFGLLLTITSSQTLQECNNFMECSTNDITNDQISCSAQYGCDRASITSTDRQTGFINCTAMFSCTQSPNLQAAKNIYCTGVKSCYSTNAMSARIIQCSGTSSCDHSLNSNAQINASTLMYCGGQESCRSAGLRVGKRTFCEGLTSCINANIISEDLVNCDGKSSCSDARIESETTVLCAGVESCTDSIIKASLVELYGTSSGEGARINGAGDVKAYGYKSINGATIDSMQDGDMAVQVFGEAAGDGAVVICRDGATCNLICKNTGCAGLEYRCLSGSTCTISPAECTEDNSGATIRGISCPERTTGVVVNSENEEEFVMEQQRVAGDLILKTLTYDVQPHYEGELDNDDEDGVEADYRSCNEDASCKSQVIIAEGGVDCNGVESCANATITTPGTSENVGCYGEDSCNMAHIEALQGFVSCLAESSCDSAQIKGKYVRCAGLDACHNIDTLEAGGLMECGGTAACEGIQILNTQTTGCSSNRACYTAIVNSDKGVICDGHYSCSESTIISGQQVKCDGKGACHEADISAATQVVINGHYGGAYSTIEANAVRGFGYHSLVFSTIDSADRAELSVSIFGHLAGYGATIICRRDSKCTLNCRGSGCKKLDFVCVDGATCILDPVKCRKEETSIHKGIDCPNMLTSVPEVYQIMKRKRYNEKKDEVYKKYKHEIEQDNRQFYMLRDYDEDLDEELDDEDVGAVVDAEEEEFFGEFEMMFNEEPLSGMSNLEGVLVIVGVVCMIGMVYGWWRVKFGVDSYKLLE